MASYYIIYSRIRKCGAARTHNIWPNAYTYKIMQTKVILLLFGCEENFERQQQRSFLELRAICANGNRLPLHCSNTKSKNEMNSIRTACCSHQHTYTNRTNTRGKKYCSLNMAPTVFEFFAKHVLPYDGITHSPLAGWLNEPFHVGGRSAQRIYHI